METLSIALLGTGTMGAGMAANLLKAGFPLTVYNRTRSKAEPLAAHGARIADTPAAAVKGARVILSMLSDDNASREAWTGPSGALAAAEPNAILVECSTASPAWISELADLAKARGLELLDAPVTGSRIQAEGGQLTFLVGGSETTLAAIRAPLEAMSKQIIHLGPVTSGAKMKLLNNFLCGVQVASLAEGLAWLERSGLDRDKALRSPQERSPRQPPHRRHLRAHGQRRLHRQLPPPPALQRPRLRTIRRSAGRRRPHHRRQCATTLRPRHRRRLR